MKIYDHYPPGTPRNACYVCGAAIRPGTITRTGVADRVVDFERHIDWEGPLCICSECVLEAAGGLGYGPQDDEIATANRRLGRQLQVAREKIERLESLVAQTVSMNKEFKAKEHAAATTR